MLLEELKEKGWLNYMSDSQWYETKIANQAETISALETKVHVLDGKIRKLIYQLCILKGENERLKRGIKLN